MSHILSILLRVIVMVIGFLFACIVAASCFLFLAGLFKSTDFTNYGVSETWFLLVISIAGYTAHFANAALVPAGLFIIYAEITSIRDWLKYVLAAALSAIIMIVGFSTTEMDLKRASIYVVVSMIGGYAYWLFVGQRAGKWREK